MSNRVPRGLFGFAAVTLGVVQVLLVSPSEVRAQNPFYDKGYALVIGIDRYPSSERFGDLQYAKRDAEGMAAFLSDRGFTVTTLYDRQATKEKIIAEMEDRLARTVSEGDRILVFFAGHGDTQEFAGTDFGYIVPYDGTDKNSTYVSMEELQTQSAKMGAAKHQLFIMVSCYGGLLGQTRGGGANAELEYLTSQKARQFITAGGAGQQVLDQGRGKYSLFTEHLLKALREGDGDKNRDGYITFAELVTYLRPAVANPYHTPVYGALPGHLQGEFVFRSPKGGPRPVTPAPTPTGPTRGARPDTVRAAGRPEVRLRSRGAALSKAQATEMLVERNFHDIGMNPEGTGITHDYVVEVLAGDTVVVDRTTGLMWQRSGFSGCATWVRDPDPIVADQIVASDYVAQLNTQRFAGYSDWRFPTLEEAMSLAETTNYNPKGRYRHFDMSVFALDPGGAFWTSDWNAQRLRWTASLDSPWALILSNLRCGDVKAVRTAF